VVEGRVADSNPLKTQADRHTSQFKKKEEKRKEKREGRKEEKRNETKKTLDISFDRNRHNVSE